MSKTVAVFPIVSALKKALEFSGAKSTVNSVNELQKIFVEEYFKTGLVGLPLFSDKELDAVASHDASVINEFLEGKGFNLRIEEFKNPKDFGAAAVMSVLVDWLLKGDQVAIRAATDNQLYPGVRLDSSIYKVLKSNRHMFPIVEIKCKNGDKVCLTIADREYDSLDLLKRILLIAESCNSHYGNYSGFYFPMVNLDQEVDISFLKGINFSTTTENYELTEVLQQTKFKMNEVGAKVESAVVMGFACGASRQMPTPVVINRPFFVWIVRNGMSLPYFAGYITENDWKASESVDLENLQIIDPPTVVKDPTETTYCLMLSSLGENRILVAKTIREILNCNMSEAKTFLSDLPCVLKSGLRNIEAIDIKQRLEKVGATIEIREE